MASAKALIERMDQACLNDNLMQVSRELGWNVTDVSKEGTVRHKPARDRLGNDTLWEFLREGNADDIALRVVETKQSCGLRFD